MSGRHLQDDELDRLLAGEDLGRDAAAHLASCLLCRHRQNAFLGAVAAARAEAEPDEAALDACRRAALAQWGQSRPLPRRWWLAAAAALFLVLLLPATRGWWGHRQAMDTEAVLEAVDATLARDPLAAVAPAELVETVVGGVEGTATGGAS